MADPNKYIVGYSFSGFQAINPGKPLPGPDLDAELAKLAVFSSEVVEALKSIRRADGSLQNGTVTWDGLNADLKARITGSAEGATVGDISPTAFASQNEAETGVANDRLMTPLSTKYAIDAQRPFASQSAAEAGTESTSDMSPLRTKDAIDAQRPFSTEAEAQAGIDDESVLSPLMAGALVRSLRRANGAEVDLTWGAIAAGESAAQSVTVSGAQVGDRVVIGLPATGIDDGLLVQAWVSSENNVRVRVLNTTGDPVTPHSGAATRYLVTSMGFTTSDNGDTEVAAQSWADVAERWAEEAEDTEVASGQYSAKHWAAKAAASASLIENVFIEQEGHFASRVDAVSAAQAAEVAGVNIKFGTVWTAEGVSYEYDGITTAISDMQGWKPHGFAASPQHFGETGTADDADVFTSWLAYLYTAEVDGWVPAGIYNISYVRDRTVTGNVSITCSEDAKIYGTLTKEDFSGDGSNTSFEVTAYTAGNDGFRVVLIDNTGTQTVLTEDTHYTLSGQTFDLSSGSSPSGAPAADETLRIVSRDPIIEIGYTSATQAKEFKWFGGEIDNSRRGYAPATDSGTGLKIFTFQQYEIRGVRFNGGDDYETNSTNGFCDTGFTAQECLHGRVHGCWFYGQCDLGTYITGGSSTGTSDNGWQHEVVGNVFYRCQTGGKNVRQTTFCNVHDNIFRECSGGWLIDGVSGGGTLTGASGSVHHNYFERMAKRAVDARRANDVQASHNVVVDFGMELDGVTPVTSATAFDMAGVTGGKIVGNTVRLQNFAQNGQVAVKLKHETTNTTIETSDFIVSGNFIRDVDTGVSEQDSTTGTVIRNNDIDDVSTDYDLLAGTMYQSGLLDLFSGSGAAHDFMRLRDNANSHDLVTRYTTDGFEFRTEPNGAGNRLLFLKHGGTAAFDGNVGIGDDAPAHALVVNGGGANEVAEFESTDATCLIRITDTNGTIKIGTGGSDPVIFNLDDVVVYRIDHTNNRHDFYNQAGTLRLRLGEANADFAVPVKPLVTTTASLPSANTAGEGARAHVTDADTPVFGSAVVGGGSTSSPVFSDGSAWIVG